jgi:hypothetical protein
MLIQASIVVDKLDKSSHHIRKMRMKHYSKTISPVASRQVNGRKSGITNANNHDNTIEIAMPLPAAK